MDELGNKSSLFLSLIGATSRPPKGSWLVASLCEIMAVDFDIVFHCNKRNIIIRILYFCVT